MKQESEIGKTIGAWIVTEVYKNFRKNKNQEQ